MSRSTSFACARPPRLTLLSCILAILGCSVLDVVSGKTPARVAVYMDNSKDVLDYNWDRSPSNLRKQLSQLGFNVHATDIANLADQQSPEAFVIPAQNGRAFFSGVEDMHAVASFLSSGGLVVLLDSNQGQGEALRDFVAKAFGYSGSWHVCRRLTTNVQSPLLHEPTLITTASYSQSQMLFPSQSHWPTSLEADPRVISVHTLCRHQDPAATVLPLYSVEQPQGGVGGGDSRVQDVPVVAQFFGKVGSPGAVVWLGYSWRDGPRERWGRLLSKLIGDFEAGAYKTPEATAADDDAEAPTLFDSVPQTVSDVSAKAGEMLRRFLTDSSTPGTYPPPPSPSPPLPAPPPPLYIGFTNLQAQGAVGKNRSLVWYDDADFSKQLRRQEPLQLVDRNKTACPDVCANCPLAWKASANATSVVLFFREPVQLSRIRIKEIKNPAVASVQLIKWSYPPTGNLSSALLGPTVYNTTTPDPTPCGSVLTVRVVKLVSGIFRKVPVNGSQAALPHHLATTAVGGVIIRVRRPANAGLAYGTWVEWVKFDGRVLYPNSTAPYQQQSA